MEWAWDIVLTADTLNTLRQRLQERDIPLGWCITKKIPAEEAMYYSMPCESMGFDQLTKTYIHNKELMASDLVKALIEKDKEIQQLKAALSSKAQVPGIYNLPHLSKEKPRAIKPQRGLCLDLD